MAWLCVRVALQIPLAETYKHESKSCLEAIIPCWNGCGALPSTCVGLWGRWGYRVFTCVDERLVQVSRCDGVNCNDMPNSSAHLVPKHSVASGAPS